MATVRQVITSGGYTNLRELLESYTSDVKAAKRYYQKSYTIAENGESQVFANNEKNEVALEQENYFVYNSSDDSGKFLSISNDGYYENQGE
jgi:hypothetical protein